MAVARGALALAPASMSSSGGWLARPAWPITCAAVSWTLPVTVTERAPKSGVWSKNHAPMTTAVPASPMTRMRSRRRPC